MKGSNNLKTCPFKGLTLMLKSPQKVNGIQKPVDTNTH